MKHQEATPRDLVLRARGQDPAAFAELIKRYETAVLRIAARITGSRAEAEDVAQESFLRAYRALARFDPDRPFGPWILKIAVNRALTRAKKRKKELPLEAAANVPDEGRTMDELMNQAEELERMRATIRNLSPSDRAILSLRYSEDLSVAEIAETLNIREGAAKVRLFRARERLMKTMRKEHP